MDKFNRFGVNIDQETPGKAVVHEIACIYSVIEKQISDYLRPFNLSPTKFNALMIIKHQGGTKGLRQVEIVKRLIATPSNITRLIDRISKEGLVERFAQEGDRRVNLVKITKKGSDLLNKVWPGYCEITEQIAAVLKNSELNDLSGLLLKWFDKLI